MDINNIRANFPALERMIYDKPLVYLDNAATSQKTRSVLEMQGRLSTQSNGNIHRAVHALSGEATEAYEKARITVKNFINASKKEEIIFTSGTTAAVNLLASSFTQAFIKKGDKIIISEAEHHSNIVPWQIACKKIGAELLIYEIDESGDWDLQKFKNLLDERVKLISINHISNVLGIINPVKELINIAHQFNIPVILDGAQGIVHSKVDVQDLDCDFYLFSGHKIYAPTGTGVLYGKEKYLELMPPYMGGGDMVGTVSFKKTTYAELPLKFEAGTPNFVGIACLAPALEFAKDLLFSREVHSCESEITSYIYSELIKIEGLRILGEGSKDLSNKIPLFSLDIKGTHPMDIATIMDKMGIALRSGMLCAEPLLAKYHCTSVLRVSFLPYNTISEARYFIKVLNRTLKIIRQ